MTAVRPFVALVAIAFASSACEIVAGIGDRKLAASGASGANAGGRSGGDAAVIGGAVGPGGSKGGIGGSGNGGAGGNGPALGGQTGIGGATAFGGAAGTGGVMTDGGLFNSGGATNAGGAISNGGGTSTGMGGSAGAGGTTGQGGTQSDGAVDAPPVADAATDPAGCPAVGMQGTGNGLLGDYFATPSLASPVLSRIDATINYDWASNGPDMGLPADGFSVRWTGQVQASFTGRHTFYTNTDDGVRLWIGGVLKMEYYEAAKLASAQLSWSNACKSREIIPQSQLYSPPAVCPAAVDGTGTGLVGQYFDNPDLTVLRVTRTDPTVSFVWPAGTSPHPSIAAGSYSVRWAGQVQARYTGFTTLYLVSEDGARLFVNDALAIDNWTSHTRTEDVATLATTAGQTYNLRIEYFEQSAGGQVQLSWGGACQSKEIVPATQLYPAYAGMVCTDPVVGTGRGLRGDYYDNADFTNLVATHAAEAVNFDWGLSAPDPSVGADTFSVRWTGKLLARYTGGTTFRTWSDDGLRLWIDGQLIINNWTDHEAAEDAGVASLVAGQFHDVKLEFHENLENALIKLLWFSPCQTEEVIPASQLFPPGYVPLDAGIDSGADAPPDTIPDANVGPEVEPLDGGVDGA